MHSVKLVTAIAVVALAAAVCVAAQPPSGKVTSIPLLDEQISSYAGYITVNAKTGSNLFFWLFEALDADVDPAKAPLLIWLNGGPGSSSMYGLFDEHGPFYLSPDGSKLIMREVTWASKYNVMYIDNPVGTGMSYTQSSNGFVTDQKEVGQDLLSFIYQFYELYPQFQAVPLYITGESYAGKYVPAFSYAVHNANLAYDRFREAVPQWTPPEVVPGGPYTPDSAAPFNVPNAKRIPLAGLAIGDGMMDPLTQIVGYGTYLYGLSMIDENQRDYMISVENQIVSLIKQQKWIEGFKLFDPLMMSDIYPYASYFTNVTGLTDYYNFNSPSYPENDFTTYLNRPDVKAALHVSPDFVYVSGNETVEQYLLSDWMQSVQPWVETLLENYPVLIYNGQNDIILSAPSCENFLRQLNWSASTQWFNAPRSVWKINPSDYEVAGYVKQQSLTGVGLTYVIVRGAGHLLPQDQPERGLDMIDRWIQQKPFSVERSEKDL